MFSSRGTVRYEERGQGYRDIEKVGKHCSTRTYLPMKMEQSVPKRRHIKFRHRGITQKKAYNIQDTAKVWNQEASVLLLQATIKRHKSIFDNLV